MHTFTSDALVEVALWVEKSYTNKRQVKIASLLAVVTGEYSKATRINRYRFMQSKLGRKIGDDPLAQFWEAL